jgi:hypothetical protein
MEQAVCDVCKDIRIGKILIQTNLCTGEPEVSDLESSVLLFMYRGLTLGVFCDPFLFAICNITFSKLCKNVYSGT